MPIRDSEMGSEGDNGKPDDLNSPRIDDVNVHKAEVSHNADLCITLENRRMQ